MIEHGKKKLAIMAADRVMNQLRCNLREGQPILVDTNVWLKCYYPPNSIEKSFDWKYSEGLQRMIDERVQLISNSVVIGEYLNAYCRIEWRAWIEWSGEQRLKYKDYMHMDEFIHVREAAADDACRILNISNYIESVVSHRTMCELLSEFNNRSCDYIDLILAEACRSNGWALYSDDKDFGRYRYDFDIITSNRNMRNPNQ